MPTVLRFDGLRVVIDPSHRRPAHVHVKGAEGEADVVLTCPDGPPALREDGHAVAAHYHRPHRPLVVALRTSVKLTVPILLVVGLADAVPRSLSEIEISASGLGLHRPQIDA